MASLLQLRESGMLHNLTWWCRIPIWEILLFTHKNEDDCRREWNSLLVSLLFCTNSLLPVQQNPCRDE